ncbi:MAG: tetratricopeptide repeat protein, partial [Thermoplasmata archaeon]
VVYGDLTSVRRRVMHKKAGEVIERIYGNEERYWGAIARHYREGNVRNKFVVYSIKAGKSAAKKFANEEAIEFFEGALRVVGESEEESTWKIELQEELADVLELAGRYDEAIEKLKERIGCVNALEAGKDYARMCEIYIKKGDYENALKMAEEGEQIVSGIEGSKIVLARLWSAKGYVYERTGNYSKAIEWQEKAKNVFVQENAEKDIGNVFNRIGACYWYLGNFEKAMEFCQKSLELREKNNDLRGIAASYNNIGIIYHEKGELDKAIEYFQKSLEIGTQIGDIASIVEAQTSLSEVYVEKSEFEAAERHLVEALQGCEQTGSKSLFANAYFVSGKLAVAKGELERGKEEIRKAVAIYEEMKSKSFGYYRAIFELGKIERNMEMLEKAHRWFESIGNRVWVERVKREIAKQ